MRLPLPSGAWRGSIRPPMSEDLLFEIGVEELPASFVTQAVAALPALVEQSLTALRLGHGAIWSSGTPRRLSVIVEGVAGAQSDLDEEVLGPPSRVAFDSSGKPTKAAESFAQKLGISVENILRLQTPKGEYIGARRSEKGLAAGQLLPAAMADWCAKIPFRKSMRWGTGDVAFGRPVRWLIGLLGNEPLAFSFAGIASGQTTEGHRFLGKGPHRIEHANKYREALRAAHVVVDQAERQQVMVERLLKAAEEAGGTLVQDAFLVEENASLVEDPQVVVGNFDESFLALPEQVILTVARGHQRYFGVRDTAGRLMPRYLAVVGTAQNPGNIRRGGDRVMRARLADAKFFYDTDLEQPLLSRHSKLGQVTFHKRLGSVGDKVRRIARLVECLGKELGIDAAVMETAKAGASLAKCDLVTLMVGELPELQGDIGCAYALVQGVAPATANVIAEHYQPRGADDPVAKSAAGALVAIADRLDTLVGCFAIGQIPTGTADPLALRRATIGFIRTLFAHGWDLSLSTAIRMAYAGFEGVKLDQSADETTERLAVFFRDRLRGLISHPSDVVEACLGAAADRPLDVQSRAEALAHIDPEVRANVGEVFKRAANIAREAPNDEQLPISPDTMPGAVHATEQEVFDALTQLKQTLGEAEARRAYPLALEAIAAVAPILARFFVDVFVMVEDLALRDNRLRLMRDIHRTCSKIAKFDLLANRKVV
jgi:glycyl-tRNA synthetase beta chain